MTNSLNSKIRDLADNKAYKSAAQTRFATETEKYNTAYQHWEDKKEALVNEGVRHNQAIADM